MFLNIPFPSSAHLQNIALIFNTVLIIMALIIFELVYSELPKNQRRHLWLFAPIATVFVILLAYAVVRQLMGKA